MILIVLTPISSLEDESAPCPGRVVKSLRQLLCAVFSRKWLTDHASLYESERRSHGHHFPRGKGPLHTTLRNVKIQIKVMGDSCPWQIPLVVWGYYICMMVS